MLPQLRSYLLENWDALPLGGPRPQELTFLVQATGVSKLCCYLFADDASEPRWVAKMARSPRDNQLLAREYGLIRHLRQHGSAFVRETVPGPLLTTSIAGHLVGIEPYLPGRPMDGLLVRATRRGEAAVRAHLDRAVEWLLRSQQETPTQRGWLTGRQMYTHLLAPIAQLKAVARLTDAEEAYLDHLAERVADLAQQHPLPLVFNHGDFRPGNILVDGRSIQVIDWEFGAPEALPLLDVFSFLARSYARCRGLEEIDGYLEDYLAAFEAVFFEGGTFAGLTAAYVDRSCQVLGIDPAWVEALFALFLVVEANKFHTFLTHRAERGYVYLLRSRNGRTDGSYAEQLARQKNVWLLGHLAQHEERLVFSDSRTISNPSPARQGTAFNRVGARRSTRRDPMTSAVEPSGDPGKRGAMRGMPRPYGFIVVILMLIVVGASRSQGFPSIGPTQTDTDPDPYVFCGVSNFAWTDRGVVARAAQPSAQSLACLRDAGFAAVVNLRHESPGYDEAAAVEALGMTYLLLPIVDDTAPSPAQVTEYMAFVDAQRRARAPVFTHDAAGRGRMGFMDGIYLLWQGWSTADVFQRYIRFGAKIDCENGGNGQIQALHEIGLLLGRGDAWPEGPDRYGNRWEDCPRPDYMADWDYSTAVFPPLARSYLPLIRK